MVAPPADIPVTIPLLFTVATFVLLLVHTPPVVALEYVVLLPAATVVAPLILLGVGGTVFTVTVLVI